jgi:hypothetical protein
MSEMKIMERTKNILSLAPLAVTWPGCLDLAPDAMYQDIMSSSN